MCVIIKLIINEKRVFLYTNADYVQYVNICAFVKIRDI